MFTPSGTTSILIYCFKCWQLVSASIGHHQAKYLQKFKNVVAYNLCQTEYIFDLPYILESNPHHFYSFRGLKNQMRIRIACGLDSWS